MSKEREALNWEPIREFWRNNSGVNWDELEVAIKEALAQPEQEPVAWMHNHIKGNVIAHRPADIERHPDHWTALYPEPKPCPTCEALARTVMLDQTSHDTPPQRKPLTQDLDAPLTLNGVAMFPRQQPLTVDEVWQNNELMALNAQLGCGLDLLMEVVEAIEAAHGIKEGA